MKVRGVMTHRPCTCRLDTPLDEASRLMGDAGCGTLVVLDRHERLAGILTDRDLAIAIGRTDRHPSRMRARDVMTRSVITCAPDDRISSALERMADARIRRLPVLGPDGDLQGVVSIDDILLWGVRHGGVRRKELLRALHAICAANERLLNTEMPDEPPVILPVTD